MGNTNVGEILSTIIGVILVVAITSLILAQIAVMLKFSYKQWKSMDTKSDNTLKLINRWKTGIKKNLN